MNSNNIVKVEVTYEDGSTFIVNPKLIPDVQGTSLEDLEPVIPETPVEVAPEPVLETPLEVPAVAE